MIHVLSAAFYPILVQRIRDTRAIASGIFDWKDLEFFTVSNKIFCKMIEHTRDSSAAEKIDENWSLHIYPLDKKEVKFDDSMVIDSEIIAQDEENAALVLIVRLESSG